jgi:chitinase
LEELQVDIWDDPIYKMDIANQIITLVVNQFPQKYGDYPGTNFANACADEYYPDPFDSSKNSKLLSNCAGVEQAINACQASGKKVMLSIGGGYPTNYTLPTPRVAAWFAEFLIGAYGPVTSAWGAKPRPFGNAVVDGFDLDLEADSWNVPSPDLLYKNYDVFGKYVKTRSKMLLSGAPQGIVPDSRISEALKTVPFDFIFVQFYNTWDVSAAKAVQDNKKGTPSTFTYRKWTNWIRENAKENRNCKVYLGLPAGPDGLPTHKDHYVNPVDANDLINQYKDDANFGGVMLWEATVSVNNPTYGQSFGTWIKYALEGTFKNKYHPVTSSSSSMMSTSSTKVSTSSTVIPTSTIKTSSTLISSTKISSSLIPSSTPVSSSIVSTSSAVSSSSSYAAASSSVLVSSASSHAVSSSASVISSSSIHVPSSSESSSVYGSLPTESSIIASSSVVSSSGYDVSSIAVSSAYPSESSTDVASSIATVSSLSSNVSNSWIDVPTSSSNSEYPASTASSSLASASEASSASTFSSVVYSDYYSKGSPSMSSSAAYPAVSSSAVVSISKGIDYPAYPAESSKNNGEDPVASITSQVYATAPSVTKAPEHSGYASAPNGTATTVITSKSSIS